MRRILRTIWNEPAASDPPPPARRDWAITGLLVAGALVEAALRSVVWKPANLVFVIAVALALPWRRTHPLGVAGSAFTAFGALSIATAVAGAPADDGLYTAAFVLMLPYSLVRWRGSDRRNSVLSVPGGYRSRDSLLAYIPGTCGWSSQTPRTRDAGPRAP